MVTGNNLANTRIQTGRSLLDAGDNAAQLRHGGIGIVAHACEHALQVALHAHAEVTACQRGQQCLQIAEVGFEGRQKPVDTGRQRTHEALLAVQRDTPVQVTMCSGIDQCRDLGFQQGFQRPAAPFHRNTEEMALVDDGVGDQLVAHAGVADLALLALAHAGQAGQRRMQAHRIAAHQLLGLQIQQLQQRRVGIRHLAFGIDHHQAGLCAVQCLSHAGIAARYRTLGFDTRAQALLHVDQALGQLADFIVGVVDAQRGVQAVVGNVAGEAQGVLDRLAYRAQHQYQAGDQHTGNQQQGQCEQHAHGACPGLLARLRLSQRGDLGLLEGGQRRCDAGRSVQQRLRFHIQADAGRGVAQQRDLIVVHAGAHGFLHIGGQAHQCEVERQLLLAGTVGMHGIAIKQQQRFLSAHLLQGQPQRRPLQRIHLRLQGVCGLLQLCGKAGIATTHLIDAFEQGDHTLRERAGGFGQRLQRLAPSGIHRYRAQRLKIGLQRLLRRQQLRAVGIVETACILGLQAARFRHPRGEAGGEIAAALVAGLVVCGPRAAVPGPGMDGGDRDQAQATDPQGRLELVGHAEPVRLQPQQHAGGRRAQRGKPHAQGPEVGDNGRHDRLQAEGRTCIGWMWSNFRRFFIRGGGRRWIRPLYRAQATGA